MPTVTVSNGVAVLGGLAAGTRYVARVRQVTAGGDEPSAWSLISSPAIVGDSGSARSPSQTLDGLVDLTEPPQFGDVLTWDGVAWVPGEESAAIAETPVAAIAIPHDGGGLTVRYNKTTTPATDQGLLLEVYEIPSLPYVIFAEQNGTSIVVQAEAEAEYSAGLSLKIDSQSGFGNQTFSFDDVGGRGTLTVTPTGDLRQTGAINITVAGISDNLTLGNYSPPAQLSYSVLPYDEPMTARIWSDSGSVYAIAGFAESDLDRSLNFSSMQTLLEISEDNGTTWTAAPSASVSSYDGRVFQDEERWAENNTLYQSSVSASEGFVLARIATYGDAGAGYTSSPSPHPVWCLPATNALPTNLSLTTDTVFIAPVSASMTPSPSVFSGTLFGGGSCTRDESFVYFDKRTSFIEYEPSTNELYDGTTQRELVLEYKAVYYGIASRRRVTCVAAVDYWVGDTALEVTVTDSAGNTVATEAKPLSSDPQSVAASFVMESGDQHTVTVTVSGEAGVRGAAPRCFSQVVPY